LTARGAAATIHAMRQVFVVSVACALAAPLSLVAACGGSDSGPGAADADASTPETGVAEGSTPDVSAPVDAGAEGAAPDASADAATGFDGGPPAWTATLAAGTETVLDTTFITPCRLEAVTVQTEVAPPKWELYLRKGDVTGFVCNEPKGVRALGAGYTMPVVSLTRRSRDFKLGLAYSMRRDPADAAPIVLTMRQVEWWSGNDMHSAIMKTKGAVGAPAEPSLEVVELFFADSVEEAAGTLRLVGNGVFPGESGTGVHFNARYDGFISDVAQPPSAADVCVRSD
jgi:hypothetical protein